MPTTDRSHLNSTPSPTPPTGTFVAYDANTPSPADRRPPDSSTSHRRKRHLIARVLRTPFWNHNRGRARTPWLILVPLVGGFTTNVVAASVLDGAISLPVVQLVTALATALVALALVIGSGRVLHARRDLAGYGLAIDRDWFTELGIGFGIGLVGVAIPFLIGISLGWLQVATTLDAGAFALWPGIAMILVAMLFVAFWEELVLRGVFVCNAADGLRSRMTPRRALLVSTVLAAAVFGLGHLGQPDNPAFILTWILAGLVFGAIYLYSGNLALPIGAHAAFNTAYNVVFVRTDNPGSDTLSAITRIDVDPDLAYLNSGGIIEAAAFLTVGLLALTWLRYSRGHLAVDPTNFDA